MIADEIQFVKDKLLEFQEDSIFKLKYEIGTYKEINRTSSPYAAHPFIILNSNTVSNLFEPIKISVTWTVNDKTHGNFKYCSPEYFQKISELYSKIESLKNDIDIREIHISLQDKTSCTIYLNSILPDEKLSFIQKIESDWSKLDIDKSYTGIVVTSLIETYSIYENHLPLIDKNIQLPNIEMTADPRDIWNFHGTPLKLYRRLYNFL
jgi:hypothetical protein